MHFLTILQFKIYFAMREAYVDLTYIKPCIDIF